MQFGNRLGFVLSITAIFGEHREHVVEYDPHRSFDWAGVFVSAKVARRFSQKNARFGVRKNALVDQGP